MRSHPRELLLSACSIPTLEGAEIDPLGGSAAGSLLRGSNVGFFLDENHHVAERSRIHRKAVLVDSDCGIGIEIPASVKWKQTEDESDVRAACPNGALELWTLISWPFLVCIVTADQAHRSGRATSSMNVWLW